MGCQNKSLYLLMAAAALVRSSATGDDVAQTQNTLKTQKLPSLDVCGKSQVSDRKIVNGTPAKLGEFPWMAAIGYKIGGLEGQTSFLCGGTLITEQYVITTAQCVKPINVKAWKVTTVRLGDLDLNPEVEDGASFQDIEAGPITYHDGYDRNKSINNIALIKLKTKVTITDKIRPICLPPPEFHLNTYEGYSPVIAGWGRAVETEPTNNTHLMKAEVKIKNTAECSRNYTSVESMRNYIIDDKVLCASAPGTDSCSGDSGGPLMFYKNTPGTGNMYLMGVVSYGYGCAREHFPGVYVRVSEYMEWILENLDI